MPTKGGAADHHAEDCGKTIEDATSCRPRRSRARLLRCDAAIELPQAIITAMRRATRTSARPNLPDGSPDHRDNPLSSAGPAAAILWRSTGAQTHDCEFEQELRATRLCGQPALAGVRSFGARAVMIASTSPRPGAPSSASFALHPTGLRQGQIITYSRSYDALPRVALNSYINRSYCAYPQANSFCSGALV